MTLDAVLLLLLPPPVLCSLAWIPPPHPDKQGAPVWLMDFTWD